MSAMTKFDGVGAFERARVRIDLKFPQLNQNTKAHLVYDNVLNFDSSGRM